MGSVEEAAQMRDAPLQGRITDEAIAAAKAMIGMRLRPEGPYLQDATVDTIRNFCNGVGDLNPLYRDAEYGRNSRYASVIAPPMFPMAYGWLGRTRWGFPGVHGFYAGNDWELFRNLRPGDRISAEERVVGVDVKDSEFSGRLAIQYVEAHFVNQHDDLVARVLGWCTRHERKAAKEKGKYKDVVKHEYSEDELTAIDKAVLEEEKNICGRNIRYWEDVEEGQALTPIARGPLSMMDTMGFLVGCGRGHTHGVLLKGALRHPGHFFRNPEAGGGVEYTGIGHHREDFAKKVGVPGMYDYLPQRASWFVSAITNWMGDDGVIKRIRMEARKFNLQGDTTFINGKVVKKYLKDRCPLVDIEMTGINQSGVLSSPGFATVMLPAKDINTKIPLDGTVVDLDLPPIR